MKRLLSWMVLASVVMADTFPVLTMNTGFNPPVSNFVEAVAQEAFLRAHIGLDFQVLPNKRSLINANSGIDDGDAARVWEIGNYYPNLVRVPASSASIDLVVLANRKVHISEPSDLSQYNVGVINGMKIAVLMAQEAKPVSLFKATNYETLVRMLISGRLDVAVINRAGLYSNMKVLEDTKLYLVDKPLMSRPLYPQLHKKNEAYVPQLTKAYQSLHDDGTYEKLYTQFYGPLIRQVEHLVTVIREEDE